MLTNIAIAMSLTLIIITTQCFLMWTFAIQRFRDTTQFKCSRQNIVLLVYQNNQFSFACFPFLSCPQQLIAPTRYQNTWKILVSHNWVSLDLSFPTNFAFPPWTQRSTQGHFVAWWPLRSKEGQNRHPGRHRAQRRGQLQRMRSSKWSTQPSRVRSTESAWTTNGISESPSERQVRQSICV
jgi:hypothetical protein